MIYLKQSTAKTLRYGPFLDEDDGKTAETGLTISQADIRLSKSGAAFAQTNDSSGATHDENGWYSLPLDATDTGTLGPLIVAIHESGALPVWREFMVVPANVYDSLVAGSDTLTADVTQIGGDTQSATDLKDFADAGYDPGTNKVQGVVLTDTCTTNTDMRGTNSAALASAVAALNDLSAADVNTEVSDVIKVDTISEIAQGVPDAEPTLQNAIMLLYMALRNQGTSTETLLRITNDAGVAIAKGTLSDDGTTFTKSELVSGA